MDRVEPDLQEGVSDFMIVDNVLRYAFSSWYTYALVGSLLARVSVAIREIMIR